MSGFLTQSDPCCQHFVFLGALVGLSSYVESDASLWAKMSTPSLEGPFLWKGSGIRLLYCGSHLLG